MVAAETNIEWKGQKFAIKPLDPEDMLLCFDDMRSEIRRLRSDPLDSLAEAAAKNLPPAALDALAKACRAEMRDSGKVTPEEVTEFIRSPVGSQWLAVWMIRKNCPEIPAAEIPGLLRAGQIEALKLAQLKAAGGGDSGRDGANAGGGSAMA